MEDRVTARDNGHLTAQLGKTVRARRELEEVGRGQQGVCCFLTIAGIAPL